MLLDVQDFNTYHNRAAAALAAFALAREQTEMLESFQHNGFEFSGIDQAFDGLGKIFHVKRERIKNYYDAFHDHITNNRKGWDRARYYTPAFLEDIFKFGQMETRQDLRSGRKKQTFLQETERACRLLMNSCQGYGFVGECNMKSVIHKKRPAQRPAEFREEFKL